MKKQLLTTTIGLLLFVPVFGYAEENVKEVEHEQATSTIASTTPLKSFTTCSQEAIENRDTKIASSRALYNTAMANALTERKNKEKAAVAVVDPSNKKDSIKTSVENYKNQAKGAQAALTQARKAAWQDFEEDIASCREIEKEATELSDGKEMRTFDIQTKKTDEVETKTIKETIKAGIESLRSLFN